MYLYGVFDGHDGSRASNFAAQRLPAELILGQLQGHKSDVDVKEVLHQAFIGVEKGFFETIDDALAERARLKMEIPEGMSYYDACRQFPDVMETLEKLNTEICGGTTACMSLIRSNKLYVANVGDSRALLCKLDSEGVLRVVQLSVDHDIKNEDELLRLQQLGLHIRTIRQCRRLGNQEITRSIGDYARKGGYKDFDLLSTAKEEPIIAEPEIHGGIPMDSSCCFLLLMSDGVFNSVIDATGTDQVNADIASMVAAEFSVQSTLFGVAQAVIDKIVRIHQDTWYTGSERASLCQKRDDMTLLVRSFNYPLPNAITSPIRNKTFSTNPLLTLSSSYSTESGSFTCYPTNQSTMMGSQTYTSTESSGSASANYCSSESCSILPLDADGKVPSYVSFEEFFKVISEDQLESQIDAVGGECERASTPDTLSPVPDENDFCSNQEENDKGSHS
ncbi:PREDICTED: TGF-beta-activated kinase 1 and MAP3K7-binding protein 1-like [Priapulus caudatus]|uniref:TGF-beta-activated kinase 1 and MAP3K7-binding protein 1-like n=1 Tax=Priapulus caudatus TaxID=37621 RepID=A0ABM1EX30_PRICU|nr:PREDICTED: TGF-beta-activated kinase 1 and MAP3K7-binding protein 1-like [Priapulus caudatus]